MNSPATPDVSNADEDIIIDVRDLLRRLRRGLPLTLGLAILGLAAGIGAAVVTRVRHVPVTSLQLTVALKRTESGALLPSNLPFRTEDLRALPIVQEALRRAGQSNPDAAAQQLQTRIGIAEVTPPKDREKLPSGPSFGPGYAPVEYRFIISSADLPLDDTTRERLLTEMAAISAAEYLRTSNVSRLPPQFGRIFDHLQGVDYSEYGLLLNREIRDLHAQLTPLLSTPNDPEVLSVMQRLTKLREIQLPLLIEELATVDLGREPGPAMDEARAQMAAIARKEQELQIEEQIYLDAMDLNRGRGTPDREQGTALGPYLVERVAEARIKLRRLALDREQLLTRVRQQQSPSAAPTPAIALPNASLDAFRSIHDALVADIRSVIDKRQNAVSADVIRITQPASTSQDKSSLRSAGTLGLTLGALLGLGISLVRRLPIHTIRL